MMISSSREVSCIACKTKFEFLLCSCDCIEIETFMKSVWSPNIDECAYLDLIILLDCELSNFASTMMKNDSLNLQKIEEKKQLKF